MPQHHACKQREDLSNPVKGLLTPAEILSARLPEFSSSDKCAAKSSQFWRFWILLPVGSMYGTLTYIYHHSNQPWILWVELKSTTTTAPFSEACAATAWKQPMATTRFPGRLRVAALYTIGAIFPQEITTQTKFKNKLNYEQPLWPLTFYKVSNEQWMHQCHNAMDASFSTSYVARPRLQSECKPLWGFPSFFVQAALLQR